MRPQIIVETVVNAPIEKIWAYWTEPEHITQWNNASSNWHTPRVENDLKVGGKFKARMEAKDGSSGFDFEGTYTAVAEQEKIEYVLADGRKVIVEFLPQNGRIMMRETFDAENMNSLEMQKSGWQSILENFKKHVEG